MTRLFDADPLWDDVTCLGCGRRVCTDACRAEQAAEADATEAKWHARRRAENNEPEPDPEPLRPLGCFVDEPDDTPY